MTRIPVFCTVTLGDQPCRAERNEHVHNPTPCSNGHDERHHDFAPPKTLAVEVEGRVQVLSIVGNAP
jgi:hypothetical protein